LMNKAGVTSAIGLKQTTPGEICRVKDSESLDGGSISH
jgi:hypothetical protein